MQVVRPRVVREKVKVMRPVEVPRKVKGKRAVPVKRMVKVTMPVRVVDMVNVTQPELSDYTVDVQVSLHTRSRAAAVHAPSRFSCHRLVQLLRF